MSQFDHERWCLPTCSCPTCGRLHHTYEELQRAERRASLCVECGQQGAEEYAATHEAWAAAGMEPMGGALHLACLERRLGRPLRREDFSPTAGMNRALLWAWGRSAPEATLGPMT